MFGIAPALRTSSTRMETRAGLAALFTPAAVSIATDSQAFLDRASFYLCDPNYKPKKNYALVSDGIRRRESA